MKNTSQLPLLVKGYNSNLNGTNSSIPATSNAVLWNNVFDSGRGEVIAIDAIQTGNHQFFGRNTGALVTISIAGIQVISGINGDDFSPIANPGNYFITPIKQPGGQTLNLNLGGGSSGNNGLQVLAFYTNNFATPEMKEKLIYARLKRKVQAFYQTVTNNAANQTSQQFTIPQSQGNVVGVEFVAYLNSAANITDISLSTITINVNGTSIIENLICSYGANHSTRPQIFPIFIQGGNTLSFNVDSSNAAAAPDFTVGLKLYFDATND
jgi:hypothetical protein